jgi:ankyrin repeat protein
MKAVVLTPPPSNLSAVDGKEEVEQQEQREQEGSSTTAGSSTCSFSDSSQRHGQTCREDETAASNTCSISSSNQCSGQTHTMSNDEELAASADGDETENESFFSTIQLVESLNDLLVVHALTQVTAYPDSLFVHCPAPTTVATNTQQQQIETTQPRLWLGKYRHGGEMLFCRIRSIDAYGTCSVVWEDGTMQMGTATCDLRKPTSLAFSISLEQKMIHAQTRRRLQCHPEEDTLVSTIKLQEGGDEEKLNDQVPLLTPASCSSSSSSSLSSSRKTVEEPVPDTITAASWTHLAIVTPELNGLTVWEAAKKGDLETCLALIDHGDATPNDLEIISHSSNVSRSSSVNSNTQQLQQQQHGRSPLYWASFCGHVELVRELLARGGVDADGSAYLAVTSRDKADDNRDLYFDPDEGIFSDGINYTSSSSSSTANTTPQDPAADTTGDQDMDTSNKRKIKTTIVDDRTLIRSMLMTAKACPMTTGNGTSNKNYFDATSNPKQLSKKLSRSSSTLSTTCSFTSQASVATHQTSGTASNNAQQQQELALTAVRSVASLVSIPEACSTPSVSSCPSTISTATNRSTRTASSHNSTRKSIRSAITIQSKATPPADNTGECVICFNTNQPLSICIPCGHISSCQTCLQTVQKNRTGCPLCQERIMVRCALF